MIALLVRFTELTGTRASGGLRAHYFHCPAAFVSPTNAEAATVPASHTTAATAAHALPMNWRFSHQEHEHEEDRGKDPRDSSELRGLRGESLSGSWSQRVIPGSALLPMDRAAWTEGHAPACPLFGADGAAPSLTGARNRRAMPESSSTFGQHEFIVRPPGSAASIPRAPAAAGSETGLHLHREWLPNCHRHPKTGCWPSARRKRRSEPESSPEPSPP